MGAGITIAGLGSGDENQLGLGIWRAIQNAKNVYLRTRHHPVVRLLDAERIAYRTFDDAYDRHASFPEVYEAISEELLRLAASGGEDILYAVPGHPRVAEMTVRLLEQGCRDRGISCRVMGGESFLDQAFLRLGFDPIEGFQLMDAPDCVADRIWPQAHTLIAQVYDALVASDVKLQLMEVYPDDYPVTVAHALGVAGEERIESVPLYELDRVRGYGNQSLIWVPRSDQEHLRNRSFSRLHEIVAVLRSPGGCPWDREQTHESLRKYLVEETNEVLEAIEQDDPQAMAEELGDVLLQVMLHSQIEEEIGAFSVRDVVQGLNEKLLRRHPHVFGDRKAGNAEEALQMWREVKAEEKRDKENKSEENRGKENRGSV